MSASTLSNHTRDSCRRQILANLADQRAPTRLHHRAESELRRRLDGWYGDFDPVPSQFGKSKYATSAIDAVDIPADPIELLIVRALAMTYPAAQFGVSPNGEVFTAHGNGWTKDGPRIYVTRLSWLLDEAADVFNHLRRGRGGRFYERDGAFFLADGKVIFINIRHAYNLETGADVGHSEINSLRPRRHNAPRARRGVEAPHIERPHTRCSLHDTDFDADGACNLCANLIASRARITDKPAVVRIKPWWQFW